jgi:hypothetical protein
MIKLMVILVLNLSRISGKYLQYKKSTTHTPVQGKLFFKNYFIAQTSLTNTKFKLKTGWQFSVLKIIQLKIC